MPLLAFIQATTSARCRSISTARQIYCVMDGRGKLQIVLSLKDRLCLTFPAPACYHRPCFEDRSLLARERNYPPRYSPSRSLCYYPPPSSPLLLFLLYICACVCIYTGIFIDFERIYGFTSYRRNAIDTCNRIHQVICLWSIYRQNL